MSLILRPGEASPDIIPYCAICDQPCERITLDLVTASQHIGIHAQCCNQTSATRITLQTYLEMRATGAKLYVIVRKGSQAGLRGRRSHLRSRAH